MVANELTEFEGKVLKWISKSDFEEIPWSTSRAADAFKVNEKEIYEALAAITAKVKDNIQIYYEDGEIRIVANEI
ncbi:MAG: hypothetical protein L7S41_06195 [Candidatus Thalassarchaeaceae archaeon]|jgi:hypothetical protein|nr:hypothetical protein [Candidatus Thalassarchaeaceae archaeon]|tara:strand:+ start:996 stop:1220 length:225 start_codon:yes stop_codon:yes gene_type:complete